MVIGLMTAGTKGTDNGCRYNSKDYTEWSHIRICTCICICLWIRSMACLWIVWFNREHTKWLHTVCTYVRTCLWIEWHAWYNRVGLSDRSREDSLLWKTRTCVRGDHCIPNGAVLGLLAHIHQGRSNKKGMYVRTDLHTHICRWVCEYVHALSMYVRTWYDVHSCTYVHRQSIQA